MASIDQFKSIVSAKEGIARSNLFTVELPALPGITTRDINLICKDVQLPGRQIMSNERRVGLKYEKMAYGYAVTDVSMTFHVLNDYGIKEYFEFWQGLAVDDKGQTVGYQRGADGYGKQVKIHQLRKGFSLPFAKKNFDLGKGLPAEIRNRLPKIGPIDLAQGQLDLSYITNDDVVYSCELEYAYPTSMNAIQLNNDLDGIVELNVQLSYSNWSSTKGPTINKTEKFLQTQIGSLVGRIFN